MILQIAIHLLLLVQITMSTVSDSHLFKQFIIIINLDEYEAMLGKFIVSA